MCKDLGNNQYECNGSCGANGGWGTGLYTADTNPFAAARHMGIVPCKFQKIMAPGCSAYIGTSMNGVSTSNYGNYGSSYFLIKISDNPMAIDHQPLKKDLRAIMKEEINQQSKSLMKPGDQQPLKKDLQTIMKEELKEQTDILMKAIKKEALLCTICLDTERSRAVFPCGHLHYCQQCVKQVRQKGECFTCKGPVTGDMKIFL